MAEIDAADLQDIGEGRLHGGERVPEAPKGGAKEEEDDEEDEEPPGYGDDDDAEDDGGGGQVFAKPKPGRISL